MIKDLAVNLSIGRDVAGPYAIGIAELFGAHLAGIAFSYDPVIPPHYDIMGLGPRTPALIISPYDRRGGNPDGGAVDHTVYEFSSVLRFIELLFKLPAMTERDKQANPLLGALDFRHPPDLKPLVLPYRRDCPYGSWAKT